MLKLLVNRPVAVTMSVVAVLILGMVSLSRLPVSLMPDVDIPRISVQVSLPGASVREVNESVIMPLRRQLLQIPSLESIRCEAVNDGGSILLKFQHGSPVSPIYLEVNEKVDRALQYLPDGMERPKVMKASATDIPAFFLDVTGVDDNLEKFMEMSCFVREVVSRRVEQIPQVAIVDISGTHGARLVVEPDMKRLKALGKDATLLEDVLLANNVPLGNLTIKDGHYQWNIRFDSEIRGQEDIENIRLNVGGRVFRFTDLATVQLAGEDADGLVRSDGRRAVTMAVIKQSDARMDDLRESMTELMDDFSKEYPELEFKVSRNQTEILDYSINNLQGNIIVGAILAVMVLLLFMRDYKSPVLVAISIPLSLVMSMLVLYLMGISINIISLSGLILGVGMMVDNSIIVIDNITQHWERGSSLREAVVKAPREVISPMLSSVLTTCSVFVPLIFLSGIAGDLFYDQAMAITVTLFSSLIVSVCVIPVYFCFFYRRQDGVVQSESLAVFSKIRYEKWYEHTLKWTFRHQRIVWLLFFGLMAVTVILFSVLPKSVLPPLTQDDMILSIDWNEPVSLEENDRRSTGLLKGMEDDIISNDILVGRQDFLLPHTPEQELSQVSLYIETGSPESLRKVKEMVSRRLGKEYPAAVWKFSPSDNIFNVVFSDDEPDLVAMIRSADGEVPDPDRLNGFITRIHEELPEIELEPVSWQEQIMFVADREKMVFWGLDYSSVYAALSRATRQKTVFEIMTGSSSVPVVIGDDVTSDLLSIELTNGDGVAVPLSEVLNERRVRDLKRIISGKEGVFYPLNMSVPDGDVKRITGVISSLVSESEEYEVHYSGAFYSGRKMIKELAVVLLVSVLLLFFILAAQFESLVQPMIILSEVCVDISGALFALLLCGAGVNLMSLIGIIVMCGIVINDSILKVDTINRYRRNGISILRAIMMGGTRRLKPIIMTSLTTILAIMPFLVRGSIGADLQYPLSVALIGGMILGTLVSLFLVPMFYYEIYRRRR